MRWIKVKFNGSFLCNFFLEAAFSLNQAEQPANSVDLIKTACYKGFFFTAQNKEKLIMTSNTSGQNTINPASRELNNLFELLTNSVNPKFIPNVKTSPITTQYAKIPFKAPEYSKPISQSRIVTPPPSYQAPTFTTSSSTSYQPSILATQAKVESFNPTSLPSSLHVEPAKPLNLPTLPPFYQPPETLPLPPLNNNGVDTWFDSSKKW